MAYRDGLAIAETLAKAMPEEFDYQNLRENFVRLLAELKTATNSSIADGSNETN